MEWKIWLWHCHLGHPSFRYLRHLFLNLFLQSKDVDFNCKTCILAKSHKTSYYASLNKSNIPCALILWCLGTFSTNYGNWPSLVCYIYRWLHLNDLALPDEDKGGGVPNIPSISHHDSDLIFSQNTSSSIR
jgi:hypothetical protein